MAESLIDHFIDEVKVFAYRASRCDTSGILNDVINIDHDLTAIGRLKYTSGITPEESKKTDEAVGKFFDNIDFFQHQCRCQSAEK